MIKIENDIILDSECDELISWYENNFNFSVKYTNNDVYRFEGIDIIQKIPLFSFTNRFFATSEIDRIRLQRVDKEIDVLEKFHSHVTPYSLIIFLNEDFDGGELIFENTIIKPKKRQMVYFTGEEKHFIKKVTVGNRYTLVCFLKSKLVHIKTKVI